MVAPIDDPQRKLAAVLAADEAIFAPGEPIEFKFTRGSWSRVEKGPNGEEVANRMLTPSGTETHEYAVARWADLGTISGHVELFSTPGFLAGRTCRVYLPPDYFTNPEARYPVLYMHDGQNLFDVRTSFAGEWRVDEACEALIGSGEIAPLIVVGIDNSDARCIEYTPWPGVPCGGGGADVFLQAIRDQLLPAINARYRTRTGPESTWMAGSSLGGLLSAYAGYQYDDTWGRIAAISPSYWYAGNMMITWASLQPKPVVDVWYHDMGTGEAATGVPNLRAMRDILISQGMVLDQDLFHVEAEGHAHTEYHWALRMPDILRRIALPGAVLAAPEAALAPGLALAAGPSPTSGATHLTLSLERASFVRVEVLDAGGRRVATVQDGALPAGRHSLRWDGREASGVRAAPGLYWVRASDASRHLSRKVVLLR